MSMSSSQPIRVMLVDDHAIVRSGLSTYLMISDDAELVGEAGSGEQALALGFGIALVMAVGALAAASSALRTRLVRT